MKKIILSAIAIAATTTTTIYAGCTANGCYDVKIDRLSVTDAGKILVGTTGNEGSLDCTPGAGVYMQLVTGSAGQNAIYSMLLTAQTTKKAVNLRIDNGTAGCTIKYAFVK
jgi:hypothetical protein